MSSIHQRAKDIFLAALARPASERQRFLAEASGDDAVLRQEVDSLLQFHEDEQMAAPDTDRLNAGFVPGEVFAGRYRMISLIGRGGMGDVWRAEDMVLGTEVALKMIDAAGSDGRERILNEVRLARQITHAAICRVFDVGEHGGVIFYSMELVRGEDLASLLRRVGRLPSEKVVDIARQLCEGLAAAHAQGVLHRDLKPANILINDEGRVRITDFGIAIPRAEASLHALTGTPAYMAPEQRVPGTRVSEQTDVYALGLVLYELLVGHDHLKRATETQQPAKPSALVPNVDGKLERAIMATLAVKPDDRPGSVVDVIAMLPEVSGVGTNRPRTGRSATTKRAAIGESKSWWLIGLGAAAVVGLVIIGASFFVSPSARTLTEQDTIVIADFDNSTGEAVFDGALKVALAVALEQSPFLKVFPDERARETLRLMERSPDARVSRTIAREIARRERLKALIAGSIAKLGTHYVLALEATNAETGDVMAREQAEAATKEEVLTSLGAVTKRLREKLGESLASVQKFDAPLPRATTPSIDALHAYSLALFEGREVPVLAAIPHLKRAIELDPTFAMAHAQLSAVYTNTGQSSLAPEYAKRAFDLRDRVSDRERFYISWRYYRDAALAWDKALELARSWTATYPREAFAFNALGVAELRLGQFEPSVAAFEEARRLDPRFIPAYSNLSASFLGLNQLPEARAVLRDAANRELEFIGARRLSYLIAFVEGDTEMMAKDLAASTGARETNSAFGWQAHASSFGGHIQAAHDQFRRGIQLSMQGSFPEVAAQLTLEDAEIHAVAGQCREALDEVPSGLMLNRDYDTLEHAARVFGMCGRSAEALSLAGEIAKRFPDATLINHVSVPVITAIVALERNQPAQVLEILEPVRPYDHAPSAEFWPAYLRGQAYLALKNGAAAEKEFQDILSHRGMVPASMLFPLSNLGLGRAARLSNDPERVRMAYDRFFTLWKEADPDLTPVKEARAEYGELR